METRGKSKSHARAYLARAHRVNKCECANAAKSSRVIRESSCKHPTKAHACDLPNPPLFCERWRVLAKKLADKSRKCTRTWPMFKYFTSICSSLVHQFDAWLRSMYKKKKKKKKMEYYFVFPIWWKLNQPKETRLCICRTPVELFTHFIHSHSIGNWRLL